MKFFSKRPCYNPQLRGATNREPQFCEPPDGIQTTSLRAWGLAFEFNVWEIARGGAQGAQGSGSRIFQALGLPGVLKVKKSQQQVAMHELRIVDSLLRARECFCMVGLATDARLPQRMRTLGRV